MIIQPRGKMQGERKERLAHSVLAGRLLKDLLKSLLSAGLGTPGLMGQCDSLDMPRRWPGLTSSSPTPSPKAALSAENAARYPKSIRSESRA